MDVEEAVVFLDREQGGRSRLAKLNQTSDEKSITVHPVVRVLPVHLHSRLRDTEHQSFPLYQVTLRQVMAILKRNNKIEESFQHRIDAYLQEMDQVTPVTQSAPEPLGNSCSPTRKALRIFHSFCL